MHMQRNFPLQCYCAIIIPSLVGTALTISPRPVVKKKKKKKVTLLRQLSFEEISF